jgi:hypothetical protein
MAAVLAGAVFAVAAAPAAVASAAGIAVAVAAAAVGKKLSSGGERAELRQLWCAKRWQRQDPIAQLAPGSTSTKKITMTTGIASAETRELSLSLGLKGNIGPAELNSQLSSRLSRTLTLSEQHQSSEEITLANDRPEYYRKFAIWHIEYTVVIDALVVVNDSLRWDRRIETAFASPSPLILTSIDVPSR